MAKLGAEVIGGPTEEIAKERVGNEIKARSHSFQLCQVVMWSSDSRSPEKRADGHLLRLPPHYLLGNAAAHRGYYCIPLLFLTH